MMNGMSKLIRQMNQPRARTANGVQFFQTSCEGVVSQVSHPNNVKRFVGHFVQNRCHLPIVVCSHTARRPVVWSNGVLVYGRYRVLVESSSIKTCGLKGSVLTS
jgi:hypothetical protein